MSKEGSERLIRSAIDYAVENKRKSVTLVHKGNIQKFTEGAFRNWGYQLAEREFAAQTYTWEQWERTKAAKGEKDANAEMDAAKKAGRVIIKDAVIADIALQQVLTRSDEFDVDCNTQPQRRLHLGCARRAGGRHRHAPQAATSTTRPGTPYSKRPTAPRRSTRTWTRSIRAQ